MTSHLHIPEVAPIIPKLPEHPRSQKRSPVDPHNNRGRRPMDYSRASFITQIPRFYSLQKEFTPSSFLRKTLDIPRRPTPKILARKAQTEKFKMKLPVPSQCCSLGRLISSFSSCACPGAILGKSPHVLTAHGELSRIIKSRSSLSESLLFFLSKVKISDETSHCSSTQTQQWLLHKL